MKKIIVIIVPYLIKILVLDEEKVENLWYTAM